MKPHCKCDLQRTQRLRLKLVAVPFASLSYKTMTLQAAFVHETGFGGYLFNDLQQNRNSFGDN